MFERTPYPNDIAMILAYHMFPPDIRVEKEAQALSQEGYKILIFAESGVKDPPVSVLHSNATVCRFPQRFQTSDQYIAHRLSRIAGLDVRRYLYIRRVLAKQEIKAIHVHDLPFALTGLFVAREFSVPLIFDMHEDYPAMIHTSLNPDQEGWFSPLMQSFQFWRWRLIERFVCRAADRIVVVVEESKQRLLREGIPESKIVVVSNTEDPQNLAQIPTNGAVLDEYVGRPIMLYVGGFEYNRGLNILIEALPMILREEQSALLLLVGAGRAEATLRKLVKMLGVCDHVVFTGRVPFTDVVSYIRGSTVCFVPHKICDHTNTTIPHKLFQYMSFGKPVVVTPVVPLKRIVESVGCGWVTCDETPQALAKAALRLLQNPDLGRKMGLQGQDAAESIYHWQHDKDRLLWMYSKLISKHK